MNPVVKHFGLRKAICFHDGEKGTGMKMDSKIELLNQIFERDLTYEDLDKDVENALEWDSFHIMEFLVMIEEQFKIRISIEQIAKVRYVRDLLRLFERSKDGMFLRDTGAITDRTAIADAFDNSFTYGELDALSEEYEAYIPTRSLVLILCDYAIETTAFYYCQMTNHVVPILVDNKIKPEFLSKIIRSYEPQFIWCSHKIEATLSETGEERVCEKGEHVILRTSFEKCEMDPNLALLLTTSGTTGSIKFVRLSYTNILCNTQAFVDKVGLCKDDRGITTLPMHHCYGLSLFHMHWLVGASVYVTDWSVLDIKFWNLFHNRKISNFAGVPYTYDMLRQIGFLENEHPSLHFVTLGGAKMSNEEKKEFAKGLQEKNINFYSCYGQTEATTFISGLSSEKVLDKPESVGGSSAGIEISVENPDEKGVGELVIKGKSVSLGYAFCKEDLALGDDNHGCLHTGDMGYVDADGDIFIRGRKARFVKILGKRISLDEIEVVLSGYFSQIEFACSGEDDRINIYYVGSGVEKQILDFCFKEFSIPGKLTECHSVALIPHTSSGKVDYVELQKTEKL